MTVHLPRFTNMLHIHVPSRVAESARNPPAVVRTVRPCVTLAASWPRRWSTTMTACGETSPTACKHPLARNVPRDVAKGCREQGSTRVQETTSPWRTYRASLVVHRRRLPRAEGSAPMLTAECRIGESRQISERDFHDTIVCRVEQRSQPQPRAPRMSNKDCLLAAEHQRGEGLQRNV